MKSLEELRQNKIIKSNMEAKVTISLKDEYKDLAELKDEMATLFIVAKADITDQTDGLNEYDSLFCKAEKFEGDQCPRCWNHFDKGTLNHITGLCPRCSQVIKKIRL